LVAIRQLAEKAFKNNPQQFLQEAYGVTLQRCNYVAVA
jgi:hypothetical protein